MGDGKRGIARNERHGYTDAKRPRKVAMEGTTSKQFERCKKARIECSRIRKEKLKFFEKEDKNTMDKA